MSGIGRRGGQPVERPELEVLDPNDATVLRAGHAYERRRGAVEELQLQGR
jgi:hypothetical protein